VRFELELKKEAAALAAGELLGMVSNGSPESFAVVALGWVRRFVDFVDTESDENASRQTLLPFWETFVQGAEKVVVTLAGTVQRTVEQYQEWLVKQAAPAIAVMVYAFGVKGLREIAGKGAWRLKPRHLEALRLHRSAVGLGA
jgi:hypothetical protein